MCYEFLMLNSPYHFKNISNKYQHQSCQLQFQLQWSLIRFLDYLYRSFYQVYYNFYMSQGQDSWDIPNKSIDDSQGTNSKFITKDIDRKQEEQNEKQSLKENANNLNQEQDQQKQKEEEKPTRRRGRTPQNQVEKEQISEKKQEVQKEEESQNSWIQQQKPEKKNKDQTQSNETFGRGRGRGKKQSQQNQKNQSEEEQLQVDVANNDKSDDWGLVAQEKTKKENIVIKRGNRQNGQSQGRRGNRNQSNNQQNDAQKPRGNRGNRGNRQEDNNQARGSQNYGNRYNNDRGDRGGRGGRERDGRQEQRSGDFRGRGRGRGDWTNNRNYNNRQRQENQEGSNNFNRDLQNGNFRRKQYDNNRGNNEQNRPTRDYNNHNPNSNRNYNNRDQNSNNQNQVNQNQNKRNQNNQSENKSQKDLKIIPRGRKCWPEIGIYIMQCKMNLVFKTINEQKSTILIVPFKDSKFELYPGNLITNNSQIDYRKKIQQKQKQTLKQPGSCYLAKSIGLTNFQVIAFLKIDQSQQSVANGLQNLFQNIRGLKKDNISITLPICQKFVNYQAAIKSIIKYLQNNKKGLFSHVELITKQGQCFKKCRTIFSKYLDDFIDNNEVLIE